MKRINIILTLILALKLATISGQSTKTVIVTKLPKTVPAGKKWVLEGGKTTKIQVSYGVLNSGSMCNALFLSNPRIIMNINRGNINNSESFSIVFKSSEKVPYTNNYTYELTPISFVDKDFSVYEFKYKSPEEVGVRKLTFKSGESVFVTNCLESIEMIEVNMTSQELAEEKKKQSEIKKEEEKKAINGHIPISTEKKDSLIKYVFFESPFQKTGGVDSDEKWSIILSQNKFKIISTDKNKVYTVLSAKYDDKYSWQIFQLADDSGLLTHNLDIHYTYESDSYVLIFRALDGSERYQFNHLKLKEILKK